MFKVQKIRSRELQADIAKLLGTEYLPDTYAFFAGELSDDLTTITSVIAMCQFSFDPEIGEIKSLDYAEGGEEDEAVFVLVRAVMNSMNEAEIPYIAFSDTSVPESFIKKLGFRYTDGKWLIDLEKFYKSPCHYNKD